MKKFLLSILCCLMAVFAVQAQETTATFMFKDLYGSSTLSSIESKTVDGITISYAKNSAQTAPAYNKDGTLRLYYASNGEGGSATFTTDGSKKITGIIITAYNNSYTPTVKYRVDGGSLVTGTWSDATMTMSGIAATNTLTIQNANTSNTQLRIKSIVLTYENITGEGGDVEDPETPVDVAEPTFTPVDGTAFDESLDVTINVEDGLTAYYSKDGGNTYTEGTNVNITETTTITAYAQDAEGNKSDEVSATYTKNTPVTPPAEGEVVDVLTRETTGVTGTNYADWSGKSVTSSAVYAGQSAGGNDAIQLRSNNNNSGIVTTASGGKATKVAVVWNSNTSSGRTLNVYGKNSQYSAATDLYNTSNRGTLLGTIVCGTSTELVIEGDYEYIGLRSASNAMYLESVSITWDESAGVTPVAKKPEFSEESCEFNLGEPFAVTISAEDGATIHYTIDGNEPTEDSDVYSAPIVISETTTVKAIAVIDGYKNSAVAEVTYTAIDPNAPTATLSFADEAQRESLSADKQVWKQNGLTFTNDKNESSTNVADYSNPVRLYKNSSITIEAARDMSEIEFDCNTAAYATSLANSIGGVTAVGDKVTVTLSPATSYTVASLSDQVRLDAITVTYAKEPEPTGFIFDFTMSEARFATLYMAVAVKIPEGVNAYIVTGTGDGYVTLQPVTGIIPANTGVILEAEQGEYELVSYAEGTADVTGNLLEGSLFDSIIEGEAYVLGNVDGNVGFYKAELDELEGTAFQNQANKAYLPASSVENKAIQYFSFDFGGGTTGIEGVEAEGAVSDRIYDITGREVKSIASPGIYIVNGKKVLVK